MMQSNKPRRAQPQSAAPGPVRLGAAVDVIVGHLRRLVLLQAWAKWEPKLTQGEVAARILERQRQRLGLGSGGASSLESHDGYDGDDGGDSDGRGDREAAGAAGPSLPGGRGRQRVRPQAREIRGGTTASSSAVSNVCGGGNGAGRCRSSPAAVSCRKENTGHTGDSCGGPRGAQGRGSAGTAVDGFTKGTARGVFEQNGEAQRRNGRIASTTAAAAAISASPTTTTPTKPSTTTTTGRSSSSGGGGGGGGGGSMLTMQTCFKQEREAFIQDLKVLHRQLEAKDRDHARREREMQAACARARAEARAAQERAASLQKEADGAAAVLAAAAARAGVTSEGLDRQTAEVETLRARLRHTERLHKEQMDVERRQRTVAAEEASAERRRLESSALTARRSLADGRRDWAAQKDTLLAAVREAGQRADLCSAEGAEAKAHAVLLEERLQHTLEREAALNGEVEALTAATRDGERRAARAEAEAGRVRAAAAAQEEAFLETAKGLEERAARAEMMQGGERATREDLHALLEESRQATVTASSEAQRGLSAANLRVVALGQEKSALSVEAEAFQRRALAAEARAESAGASAGDAAARLEDALSENRRDTVAAAVERERLERQWRRREEGLRLALVRAHRGEGGGEEALAASGGQKEEGGGGRVESGEEGGVDEAWVLAEVESLREAVVRLSREKERLLDQLSRSAATATNTSTNTAESSRKQEEGGDSFEAERSARISGGGGGASSDEQERHGGGKEEERHWEQQQQQQEEDDDEALLMPRGGPAPTPSRFTPHSSKVNLGASGGSWAGGGGAAAVAATRPLGRSVAAATLLRASLERERSLRRWEHESLLAVLREGNVIVDDRHHRRRRRRPDAAGPPSKPPADAVAAAAAAAPAPAPAAPTNQGGDIDATTAVHQQHKYYAEESGGAEGEKEAGERRREGGEEEEEAAWRGILAALENFLQSHSRRRRGQSRSSAAADDDDDEGGCWDPGRAPDRRRRRFRQRQRERGQPTSAAAGGPPGVGTSDDGRSNSVGRSSEEEEEAYSGSSCSSWPSSPSPLCSGSSQDDDSRGGGSPPPPPPPPPEGSCRGGVGAGSHPQPARTRRRRNEIAITVARGPSDAKLDSTAAGGGKSTTPSGQEGSDADEVGAFSDALAAALRELLSSTLGVPEEGVREAPLPELVRALQREWEGLLEGLSAMQEEVDIARQQAARFAASTTTAGAGASPSEPATGAPGVWPETATAQERMRGSERRAAELEAALAEARKTEAGVRAGAQAAAMEADQALRMSERDRSDATARLAAALRDLAQERADGAVRLAALKADLRRALSAKAEEAAAAATATEESAAAAAESFRRSLEAATREREEEAEGLRGAAAATRRRAEAAEGLVRGLEGELAAAAVAVGRGGSGWDGGEDERREAQQRVKALEAALEKLAKTGSAAEGLSKQQLEITRELSVERDELAEENESSAARLDQLTTALQEQREEKARLANQLVDRERGLEALRAQSDVEKVKVARLQEEVGKAQGVCQEMSARLLELQATQDELRATRHSLEQASQELETLRRSKDSLSGGWDEVNRLRERLSGAESLCAEMSARAAAAEPLVEEESQRARHLEARVEALQRQLDQVPNDLLVAHAEKRVLQAALGQAKQDAAGIEASTAVELRRRDADARNLASAAALQQELCGEKLREQALTIHQLTLQGFSAEASAQVQQQQQQQQQQQRRQQAARQDGRPQVCGDPALAAIDLAAERKERLPPRRGYYRCGGDNDDAEDRRLWAQSTSGGRWSSSSHAYHARRSDPRKVARGSSGEGQAWAEFPPNRQAAVAAASRPEGRPGYVHDEGNPRRHDSSSHVPEGGSRRSGGDLRRTRAREERGTVETAGAQCFSSWPGPGFAGEAPIDFGLDRGGDGM